MLEALNKLARNMWWLWNPPAGTVFSEIDSDLWNQCGENPVMLLDTIQSSRLEEMGRNKEYMKLYSDTMAAFDKYMADTGCDLALPNNVSSSGPVAFFSMEFGLHHCLPLYAGGLGVLAGDYLKSASDMKLPVVGVGLLYRQGYLKQGMDAEGNQTVEHPDHDPVTLPVEPVTDSQGERVSVSIDLAGREVTAIVWKVNVGRVSLYLLDTNVPGNSPEDREITGRLYHDDREGRIRQEMLLGIGGVRALARLGIEPSVYHMNEGHTSFLLVERCRAMVVGKGFDLGLAMEAIRASSVLTVHTPVAAGNEMFGEEMLSAYLRKYVEEMGMAWMDFQCLGRDGKTDDGVFVMTAFALRLANRTNAVSRVHTTVSREMWEGVWHGFPYAEVPIMHIRNGIHMPTWAGPETSGILAKADMTPDRDLWEAHNKQKVEAIANIKRMTAGTGNLDSDALTIVWARRFAPYKRPMLVFSDAERLFRIVNNPEMPVQILIAGKAHPEDPDGCSLVREVVGMCRSENARGRIVFLEDYDLRTAPHLVQAADVWLNTPRRRMEASGTSGQKACVNGGLNLSVLDGWWEEAHDGSNGWAIGAEQICDDISSRDVADAQSLYTTLENIVIPLYYERDSNGMPGRWLEIMRNSMGTIAPMFNTDRMISEYFEDMYTPSAKRTSLLSSNQFEKAAKLAGWKRDISARFSSVSISDVSVEGIQDDDILTAGSQVTVTVKVNAGALSPDEIVVEMVLFNMQSGHSAERPLTVKMDRDEKLGNEWYLFRGRFKPVFSGQYSHGVRILPYHRYLGSKQELGLVLWS